MKTIRIISFLILIVMSTHANAQLRVLSNGRVQAGYLRDFNEDLGNATTMQLFGKNGEYRTGSKLSFGDFGQQVNQGWNVFIGEYDDDLLWLHGKFGTYLTSHGYANNIVAYFNPTLSTNFVFNTNLRVNGVTITSDARLKENVKSLQNPLDILSQLNGVTYTYSLSELQQTRKQEEVLATQSVAGEAAGTGKMSEPATDAASLAKAAKDSQIQREIDKKEAEDANRKRIGFMAQDIQKVLPELVQTDENGMMSIDYIGFIPLIVESIKEMQQTISEQNQQIANLQNLLSVETKSSGDAANNTPNSIDGARLYNVEGASVGYSLPSVFTTANLQIFDITGKLIKKIDLDNSRSVAEVHSTETGYGTFIYTLFVDGQKRDVLKKYVNR